MITYRLTNPLEHGEDVKRIQTALHKAGIYKGAIDGVFGEGTADAAKQAKYRLGYPMWAVVKTGGQTLLDYLDGNKQLPLAYQIRRKARGFGLTKEDKLREAICAEARWGVANERTIHYTMSSMRDDWLWRPKHTLPMYTDCSGFFTACYKWAGAPDPNNLGYRAVGYTGTLLQHGEQIHLWQAKPGDAVVWGAFPGHHVAVIVDMANVKDPRIIEHGWEGGPNYSTVSIETSQQQRPYTVLRFPL